LILLGFLRDTLGYYKKIYPKINARGKLGIGWSY